MRTLDFIFYRHGPTKPTHHAAEEFFAKYSHPAHKPSEGSPPYHDCVRRGRRTDDGILPALAAGKDGPETEELSVHRDLYYNFQP